MMLSPVVVRWLGAGLICLLPLHLSGLGTWAIGCRCIKRPLARDGFYTLTVLNVPDLKLISLKNASSSVILRIASFVAGLLSEPRNLALTTVVNALG